MWRAGSSGPGLSMNRDSRMRRVMQLLHSPKLSDSEIREMSDLSYELDLTIQDVIEYAEQENRIESPETNINKLKSKSL